MAPLLIDGRGLVKLGLISVLLVTAVFAGGFLSGYQQAAAFYLAGSDVQALSLPEQIMSKENDIELQTPEVAEVAEAGEEIDVDQAEALSKVDSPASVLVLTLANNKKQMPEPVPVQTAAHENKSNALGLLIQAPGSVINKDNEAHRTNEAGLDAAKNDSNEHELVRANKQNVRSKLTNTQLTKVIASNTFKGAEFTAEGLKEIKYSIQVGMYGRLVNAENMVQMLQAQQYDAYITDYINKKNEIRYNVRVGYFSDKKSAVDRLNEFKSDRNNDGYLVKFSSENIVNLAQGDLSRAIVSQASVETN